MKYSPAVLFLAPLLLINNVMAQQDFSLKYCLTNSSKAINSECSPSKSDLNPINIHRIGKGNNNVVQSLALNQTGRELYSLNVTGHPELGVINRYIDIDGKSDLIAIDAQNPTAEIGHQGLSILPSTDWLLSSAGSKIKNRGWYITAFKYNPNNAPKEVKIIKIFGNGYDKKAYTMPTVTPNGKYLIVRGKKHNTNIIRVYDLEHIDLPNQKKLGNNYLYEWSIDDRLIKDGFYFQGITADNHSIYMLSGLANQTAKTFMSYSIDGKLLEYIDDVSIGKEDSLRTGNINYWEPESLTYDSKRNSLLILFAMGDKGKRIARFYQLKLR